MEWQHVHTLIETQTTNAQGKIAFTADLPLGIYYVKEIKAAPGYLLDGERYDVDFTYQGQHIKVITNTLEVKDEPTTTEISKTDITTGEEVVGAKLEILDFLWGNIRFMKRPPQQNRGM